uniref:Myeloid cell nuclear differentiation antigen n=1 Tax=Loxodonta africana TaxID=9785 RepID=G3SR44_LOXAF
MGNEYKKIVLLNELDDIDDYSFKILKNFLARDLQLTKKMEEKYGRTKIADLMEEKFQGAAYRMLRRAKLKGNRFEVQGKNKRQRQDRIRGSGKSLTDMHDCLEDGMNMFIVQCHTGKTRGSPCSLMKKKNTAKEKPVAKKKKVSQEQSQPPCPSGASSSATVGHSPPPQISSPTPSFTSLTETYCNNEKENHNTVNKQLPEKNVLQKGPELVLVLKTTEPFEYESPTTVATENKFFQLKVFNTNLKEKFQGGSIALADYVEFKEILEINETSSVYETGPDQRLEVPNRIIKRATETPKINNFQKQASGTLLYGLFMLLKKTVNKKNTIYEIQDNTGKMDVVGDGKWQNIKSEERDTLQFFCFQLRTIEYKLKLMCGIHSFIKV